MMEHLEPISILGSITRISSLIVDGTLDGTIDFSATYYIMDFSTGFVRKFFVN